MSWTQRAYRYLLERWLRNPDAYWTWYRPALRKARELVRRYQIPLVFTSADPYTSHRIGLALQREGCRWVTDLRDPHAYAAETSSPRSVVRKKQIEIERQAVTKADAVTTASGAIGLIVTDMYGLKDTERLCFIPVGVDEELLPPPDDRPLRPWPYLLFCGEYLDRYGTEFIEVFAEALRIGEGSQLAHRLLVVGREEVNRPRILPAAQRFGIADRIEFLDHMPQQQLYRFVRGAAFALLPGSRAARWWCLPAKLADYIFFRKHVIAVVPDPSEARTRLLQANLGIFLDGDRCTCADTLMRALTGRLRLPEPNQAECDRYSARRQVESFIGIFERLLSARHP